MSKYFQENGFLSSQGECLVSLIVNSLNRLMTSPEINNMSIQELQILGSNLSKIVGDNISKSIVVKIKEKNELFNMTDDEFELYLKNKYQSKWPLVSLTQLELDRLPKLSKNDINLIMSKAIDDANSFEQNTPKVNLNPDIRYK